MAKKKKKFSKIDLLREKPALQGHPIAECLPSMTGPDYDALVNDINKNGLMHPIILYQGKILDGRNRYRACLDANIKPRFKKYGGRNPVGYAISTNVRRRHLNDGQKAITGAKLASLRQGQKKSDTAAAVSQKEAAERVGISIDSIQRARVVLDNGIPELVAAVERGEISVSKAAATLRNPRQRTARSANLFNLLKDESGAAAEIDSIVTAAREAVQQLESIIVQAIVVSKSVGPRRQTKALAKYHAAVAELVEQVRQAMRQKTPIDPQRGRLNAA